MMARAAVVVIGCQLSHFLSGCGGGDTDDNGGCQVSDLSEVAAAAKSGQWVNIGSGAEFQASWSWDLAYSDPAWVGGLQEALKMGFSLLGPVGTVVGEVAANAAPAVVQHFNNDFDQIENAGADSKTETVKVPNQDRGVVYQWQWVVQCKGKNNSVKTRDFQVMQSQSPCCLPGQFKKNGDPLQGCKTDTVLCAISTTTTTTTTTTLEACPNRDGHDGVKEWDSGYKCYGTAPSCSGVKSDCWKHGYVYIKSDSDCRGTESSCWSGDKVVCRKISQCCDGYVEVKSDNADPKCELKSGLKDFPNITIA